ncbi:aspartate/glutamate racemase family protein [Roseinatronobacter bogoriensis]|uniref:Asp/Glu/hydantoin racemase n=1 Tax=Roseinatronobacter bogoriensis subsp. barguzinensis TaxID=441209 RepID=A0A2K8KDF0_9RHOB|nr:MULTISPECIES: aspartate/glutamate racemase family protein [Rhodobaca]ATX67482.1 Asp/Glu/hydantoin racemase [Rhodobaca barguzinensis]MBB4207071.1 allantoin racemase [Rhodobaca bogoriensis DSM 18756]TDW35998.1 allantoin racemase [Rhodobaca barguzinensis]TDY74011.1 allantoin racemase [Rhodobaca bogoriensis DSM 18756]
MLIHVINPNASREMTEQIAIAAREGAGPNSRIEVSGGQATPVSIEGYADEALAVPAMLNAIHAVDQRGAAAHVIACFDDPGLSAAREVAGAPVVGTCQAAVQFAMTVAVRFSVVTTLPRSVPIIEDLVSAYGAGRHCRGVHAVNLPVLAFETDEGTARAKLLHAVRAAQKADNVDAVVLGCAGMTSLTRWLSAECGIPVIDGVTAAVRMAEALAASGYRTSKTGGYATPIQKAGGFERMAS